MTAEIVIFNNKGLAMAADSAVTSHIAGIDKISCSANKLFPLSSHSPVGIMIYGNSEFMDVPWEVIINMYKLKLASNKFNTLEEYAKDFLSFLSNKNINFGEYCYPNYFERFVFSYLNQTNIMLEAEIRQKSFMLKKTDVIVCFKRIINQTSKYISKLDSTFLTAEKSKLLFKKYRKIEKSYEDYFFNWLKIEDRAMLRKAMILAFSKWIDPYISSGIVIAGFGEREVFPSVKTFEVEGIIKLGDDEEVIKYDAIVDKSKSSETDASVIPFAQDEMVHQFMNGVDPDYVKTSSEKLNDLFKIYTNKVLSPLNKYSKVEQQKLKKKIKSYCNSMINKFNKELHDYRKDYSKQTIDAVIRLNKNELASMAEALVYVTVLKRKVSSQSETVAEPIDVAVISKGDGFVWIKRKSYFDPKMNNQFFLKNQKEIFNDL